MLCNFGPEKFEKVLNFERRFSKGTSRPNSYKMYTKLLGILIYLDYDRIFSMFINFFDTVIKSELFN